MPGLVIPMHFLNACALASADARMSCTSAADFCRSAKAPRPGRDFCCPSLNFGEAHTGGSKEPDAAKRAAKRATETEHTEHHRKSRKIFADKRAAKRAAETEQREHQRASKDIFAVKRAARRATGMEQLNTAQMLHHSL
eukprot:1156689-Pelagomonas_calceolata.AAC.5